MRFMLLMIPKGYENAPAGTLPSVRDVARMAKFNKEITNAGIVLAMDGLHPPAMGARVTWSAGKPEVTDGPFAEAKEVLGGYWMIEVKSREEAVEWAKRVPGDENATVEVRQVQEMSDFPPEVQKAARLN